MMTQSVFVLMQTILCVALVACDARVHERSVWSDASIANAREDATAALPSCEETCQQVAEGCRIPLSRQCSELCENTLDPAQLQCLRGIRCSDLSMVLRQVSYACGLEPKESAPKRCLELGDTCDSYQRCCPGTACRTVQFTGETSARSCQKI